MASSPFSSLIDQQIHIVPHFVLECGAELKDTPVAYKTWGTLNQRRDNVMIICHAFTGSADVQDWWGPLMGRGKAFDPHRYFIFCANVLGSPYGTASPVTINPHTSEPYGPEFPPTTIRDDVRLHKLVLDALGVSSVSVVIGGSMGGMAALEYPLCTPPGYIKHIIPIATCARHSAWGISWGEAQRQSIFSDPGYMDGYYGLTQPAVGLAAARMTALLTYRSRDSFETRFGRRPQANGRSTPTNGSTLSSDPSFPPKIAAPTQPHSPKHFECSHNDGHRKKNSKSPRPSSNPSPSLPNAENGPTPDTIATPKPIFSAQSYLRYQGDKFTARFDANCYIHITRKMDSHDLARDRVLLSSNGHGGCPTDNKLASLEPPIHHHAHHHHHPLSQILLTLPPRALVIGIASDGLFTLPEQQELAQHIPDAELVVIQSPDGHDGFLLEFEQINTHILRFLKKEFPELYKLPSVNGGGGVCDGADGGDGTVNDFAITKTSIFGEAEVDIAQW